MATCLGKSYSIGLLRVSCVGVCQFVSVFLSLLVLRVGCGAPGHYLSFYYVYR